MLFITIFVVLAVIAATYISLVHLIRRLNPIYSLRKKHVWVIGASSGIGKALSLNLALEHEAVVSLSARRHDLLNELQRQLSKNCGVVVPLDITADLTYLNESVNAVRSLGPVDVVILNAGVNQGNKRFDEMDIGIIDAIVQTNFSGNIRLASLMIPLLRETGGVLCVISSLTAYRGLPGASVYGATKAALTSLCQSLNVELYNDPVDVVCVHPGFVNTSAIRDLKHPKPFILSDTAAAKAIVRAVELRKHHVGFPLVMEQVIMRATTLVPTPLYNFILNRMM